MLVLLTSFTFLCLAAAAPSPLAPRWSSCETEPLSGPPNVSTPLDTIYGLGAYAPYISQHSSYCRNVPDGFVIDQVSIVSRHGARSPTASALKSIQSSLAKLANVTITNETLAFAQSYSLDGFTADALTDYGRYELYLSGATHAKIYQDLAHDIFARVIESSQYFLQGFLGEDFVIKNTSDLPEPQVIISETTGLNNTLIVSNCPADENYTPNLETTAQTNWLSVYTPPIISRLESQASGANLTGTDVLNFMSLCGFDAINQGTTYAESEWCSLFEADEWAQNGYYFDVEKWWGHSYGDPYVKAEYAGFVNELIARLNDSAPLLGGAINTTLDTDPSTFPLNRTFYADFTHDDNMASILAALSIWQEADLPSKPNPLDLPPHHFVASRLVPFASRSAIERLLAPWGAHYVRILVNDAVVPLTYPDCGDYGYDGLCELDAFIAAQAYSQAQPSHFDEICYAAQINVTVVV